MPKSVNLQVITPSKLFYDGEVELIIANTPTGEEGFMASHAWSCKLLVPGELLIREVGSQELKSVALSGGFIDIKEDFVIYSDTAEWAEEIDVDRAMGAKDDAEEWLSLNAGKNKDDEEMLFAHRNLAVQKTRVKVAGGGSRKKR
jgi:F-type H+-transporting ATPase subunit epsilon